MSRKILLLILVMLLAGTARASEPLPEDHPSWWASSLHLAQKDDYYLADQHTLETLIKAHPDLLILDTRSDYEFKTGHMPNAVNLEFDLDDKTRISPEKKKAFLHILGTDTKRPVLIYCRSFR